MHSRMDLTSSDDRRDAKSKKKYDLSLKRGKQNLKSISDYSVGRETERAPLIAPKTRDDTANSGDSQNFMLRLSDSFAADDTFEDPKSGKPVTESKKPEVILISDSSDDSSPDKLDLMRFKSSESTRERAKIGDSRSRSVYLIKSSDSEDSDESKRQRSSKAGSEVKKLPAKEPGKKCSILYTSDDLLSENDSAMNFDNKENTAKRREIPESHKMIRNVEAKSLPKSDKTRTILTDNRCNINTPEKGKSLREIARKPEETKRTPISAKIFSRTTLLTKKDTRDILKAIKSTRLVHESPRGGWKKARGSDSSGTDESEVSSPVANNEGDEKIARKNAIVIPETDSDSDDKVIQGSRLDWSKPCKTHVSRFLEPAITDEASMSEKKKLEIAQWLMTNSRDSRSDSSVSNISASQKNSPNSGNSSLERLELNYETPNNRGKVQTPNIGARSNAGASSIKSNAAASSVRSVKSVRQTTIDNFVRTSKDGTNILTTIGTPVSKRNDLISPAVKEATEALGLMDCADILDNLYGKAWREKANDLLPSTEPRKANVTRKDKAVQTERKVYPRPKKAVGKSSESSSREDDFDKLLREIRSTPNSTMKPVGKTNQRRCSFINDSSASSSDNDCESTYMTALTTPRISNNRRLGNRETPISAALQKIKDLCDTDSDDDEENSKNKQPINYRKQLSYSDDESNSSTSEYDPSDIIPQKLPTKPAEALKTSKTASKVARTPIYSQQRRIEKSKTFLESLSATIPLIEAHPDVKKFRQNFKNTKEELCKYLYKLYNEKIFDSKLPSDMSIEWNVRMRGTAGFCYNKRSVKALGRITRSSRIVLATKILDTPDRLRDTLVHEMCHAAAWLINEVSDGHGPFWKAWASKAMKTFPELPAISRCHDYDIKTKFTYRCVGCGYSIGRHSKSLNVEKKRCGHCYGKFELLINKVTKSGTVEVKTPSTKKPTAFALFVKENYSTVKKERKGVAHKEVMQILGQQFSAIKISKKNGNSDDNNSDSVSNV